MCDEEMGDWVPPNEAEMKVIDARRKRNNEISKLMASHMLKGYRMLDSVCPVCQTVLLREPTGQDYCVACKEIESDPEVNGLQPLNTKSPVAEVEDNQGQPPDSELSVDVENDKTTVTDDELTEESSCASQPSMQSNPADAEVSQVFQHDFNYSQGGIPLFNAYFRLKSKIDKLSKTLVECNSTSECKAICEAIKTCADTALSIKKLL